MRKPFNIRALESYVDRCVSAKPLKPDRNDKLICPEDGKKLIDFESMSRIDNEAIYALFECPLCHSLYEVSYNDFSDNYRG